MGRFQPNQAYGTQGFSPQQVTEVLVSVSIRVHSFEPIPEKEYKQHEDKKSLIRLLVLGVTGV